MVDGIVDEKLCRDLLDLVTEPGWATTSKTVGDNNTGRAQAATNEGPPLAKWERGLSDVDSEEASPGMTTLAGADSWGLTNEAIEWLCQEGEHPALVEVSTAKRRFRVVFRCSRYCPIEGFWVYFDLCLGATYANNIDPLCCIYFGW